MNVDDDGEDEVQAPAPKRRRFPFPTIRLPRIVRTILVATVGIVVLVFVVGGAVYGVLRLLHVQVHLPGPLANLEMRAAAKPEPPKKIATPTPTQPPPEPLPSGAPAVNSSYDARIAFPFARRLMRVNDLAGKRIVTFAEFHNTDQGDRYYLAVVSSCKDLEAIWPIANGALDRKVVGPLHLQEDFSRFAFVQRDSEGQWGVITCDGST